MSTARQVGCVSKGYSWSVFGIDYLYYNSGMLRRSMLDFMRSNEIYSIRILNSHTFCSAMLYIAFHCLHLLSLIPDRNYPRIHP